MLDNEGKRLIAKYYNAPEGLESGAAQKAFERKLFQKASKHSGSKLSSFENDIMYLDGFISIFRYYVDMSIFIIGHNSDNELVRLRTI